MRQCYTFHECSSLVDLSLQCFELTEFSYNDFLHGVALLVKIGLQVIAGDSVGLLQLFAALKDNMSVTSIDLSDNVITDDGMNFLTGVLAVGMAPNLIHINLKGNPISSKGRELLAGLYHLRKQLLVGQRTTEILILLKCLSIRLIGIPAMQYRLACSVHHHNAQWFLIFFCKLHQCISPSQRSGHFAMDLLFHLKQRN